jgi:hypothetical protein
MVGNFFSDFVGQWQNPEATSSGLPLMLVAVFFFAGTTFVVYKILMKIKGENENGEETKSPEAPVETTVPIFTLEGKVRYFLKNLFRRTVREEVLVTTTRPEETAAANAPAEPPAAAIYEPIRAAEPPNKFDFKNSKIQELEVEPGEPEDEIPRPSDPEKTLFAIPRENRMSRPAEPEIKPSLLGDAQDEILTLQKTAKASTLRVAELQREVQSLDQQLIDAKKREAVNLTRADHLETVLKEVISEVEALHRQNAQVVAFQPIGHELEQLLRSAESVRKGATSRIKAEPNPVIQAQAAEISKLKELLVVCKRQIIDLSRRKAA